MFWHSPPPQQQTLHLLGLKVMRLFQDWLQKRPLKGHKVKPFTWFKTGSTHDFGIVYYDRFNRSGFVNRIGSIYVPTLGERRALDAAAPLGAASVRVTFSDSYNPPSWATRYQIVYSGRSSVGDFTQYTVGNGFAVRQKHDTAEDDGIDRYKTAVDENSHRIYVSLKTLDTCTTPTSLL